MRKGASPPGTTTEEQRQEEDRERLPALGPTSPCREAIKGPVALLSYPRRPRAFPCPESLRQASEQVLSPSPIPFHFIETTAL